MMRIAEEFTSVVSGSVDRVVDCESCHQSYVYVVNRTGIGKTTNLIFQDGSDAYRRAGAIAKSQLERRLEVGIEIVPCPSCGWFQKDMVTLARSRHLRSLLYLAMMLITAATIVFLIGVFSLLRPGPQSIPSGVWVGMGVLAVSAIVLVAVRFWLSTTFDPNDEPIAKRIEIAELARLIRPPTLVRGY
jgi:hypothetical protein